MSSDQFRLDSLISYLTSQLQVGLQSHPQHLKVLQDPTLTLQSLQKYENEQLANQLPQGMAGNYAVLLWCKICQAALQSQNFTSKTAWSYYQRISWIKHNVQNFDISQDLPSFLGRVCEGALQVDQLENLNTFKSILTDIQQYSQNPLIETANKVIQDKYTEVISRSTPNSGDKREILNTFKELARMDGLGVQIQDPSSKEIILMVGITYYQSQASPQEMKELVGVLQNVVINDQTIQLQIQRVKTKYGSQNVDIGGLQVDNKIIEMSQSVEQEKDSDTVSNRSQLELNEFPIFTSSNNDPKVYVWKASFNCRGRKIPVVTKEYHSESTENLQKFGQKQAKILKKFSGTSSSFLKFYGTYYGVREDGNHFLGIVMQQCQSDLMTVILKRKKQGNSFSEQELRYMVDSLIQGFCILQSSRVYHHDVKPQNILINNGVLKISDFNISTILEQNISATTFTTGSHPIQGTDGYMPPQIQMYFDLVSQGSMKAQNISYRESKVDVYSLGLVFLQLYTLESVKGFNKEQNKRNLEKILNDIPYQWLQAILAVMLQFKHRERPRFKDIRKYLPKDETIANTTIIN